LLRAQSGLSSGLITQLGKGGAGVRNIIVSPASVGAALALIDLGADDSFELAIHSTLGFQQKDDRTVIRGDLQSLRDVFGSLQAENAMLDVFAMANAILVDPKIQPVQATLDRVTESGATVFRESLSGPNIRGQLNDWLSARTKGRISSIFDQAPAGSGLIALNALYFIDKWRVQFDKARTHSESFRLVNGSLHEVAMMTVLMEQALARIIQPIDPLVAQAGVLA
jgi:serine protease inhibitor